ncbi:hypothetical protein NPA07_00720 [Mycoplasmopsis caviae]|uniref:Lipoprotein n=1 Tax=Mycoplasmopsis caviae TaxID=55603 RepID=A0A3P8L6Y4_9BACT|nr:hypothetical protein [Mycoplasmopsis caviae]UUD35388.1 hypothetical protein NPA07_00720 [Mycoplasmopsis caviae]VDR41835.1 Uncharacterised protein [Mycoplasmopsis caviae]
MKNRKKLTLLSSFGTLPMIFASSSCGGGKTRTDETREDLNKIAKNVSFDVQDKQNKLSNEIKDVSNLIINNLDKSKYSIVDFSIETFETSVKIQYRVMNSKNLTSDKNTYEIVGFKKPDQLAANYVPSYNPTSNLIEESKKVIIDCVESNKNELDCADENSYNLVASGYDSNLYSLNFTKKYIDEVNSEIYVFYKMTEKSNGISVDGYYKVSGFKPFDSSDPEKADIANKSKEVTFSYKDIANSTVADFNEALLKFNNNHSGTHDAKVDDDETSISIIEKDSSVIFQWRYIKKDDNSFVQRVAILDGFKKTVFNSKKTKLDTSSNGVFVIAPKKEVSDTTKLVEFLDDNFDVAKTFYEKNQNFAIYSNEHVVYGTDDKNTKVNSITEEVLEKAAKVDPLTSTTSFNSYKKLENLEEFNAYQDTKFVLVGYKINGNKAEVEFKLYANYDGKGLISNKSFKKEIDLAQSSNNEKEHLDKLIDSYNFDLPYGLKQFHAFKVLNYLVKNEVDEYTNSTMQKLDFFGVERKKKALEELKKTWNDVNESNIYLNIVNYRLDKTSFEIDVTINYNKYDNNGNLQQVFSKVRTLKYDGFNEIDSLIELVEQLNKSMNIVINPESNYEDFYSSIIDLIVNWKNGSSINSTVNYFPIEFSNKEALAKLHDYYAKNWDINALNSELAKESDYSSMVPNVVFRINQVKNNINISLVIDGYDNYKPEFNGFDLDFAKQTYKELLETENNEKYIHPTNDEKIKNYVKTDDFKTNLEANIINNFNIYDLIKDETKNSTKQIRDFKLDDFISFETDKFSKNDIVMVNNINDYLNGKLSSQFISFIKAYENQAYQAINTNTIERDQALFKYTIKEFTNIDSYQSKVKLQAEMYLIETKEWLVVNEFEFNYHHDSEIIKKHISESANISNQLKDAQIEVSKDNEQKLIDLVTKFGYNEALSTNKDKLEFYNLLVSNGGFKGSMHKKAVSFIETYLKKILIVKNYNNFWTNIIEGFYYNEETSKVEISLRNFSEIVKVNVNSSAFNSKILDLIKFTSNRHLQKFNEELRTNGVLKLKDGRILDEALDDVSINNIIEVDYNKTTDKGKRFLFKPQRWQREYLISYIIDTKMREVLGFWAPYIVNFDAQQLKSEAFGLINPIIKKMNEIHMYSLGGYISIKNDKQKELFDLVKDKTDEWSINTIVREKEFFDKFKEYIVIHNSIIDEEFKKEIVNNIYIYSAKRKDNVLTVSIRIKGTKETTEIQINGS